MAGISSEALLFLKQLRENNHREWFNARKDHFIALRDEVKEVFGEIALNLNEHDDISKWRQYRIYRNLMFSQDKTPYKKYYAAEFTRKKPELRGGYYVHIEPGNRSFIEGGFWGPNKDDLMRVRQEWEMHSEEIYAILNDENFKKYWGKMLGKKLKSAPKGFDREHPDIKLLNHQQWYFRHDLSDEEVLDHNFTQKVDEYYRAIRPFFDYMSHVLTTDLNGESIL